MKGPDEGENPVVRSKGFQWALSLYGLNLGDMLFTLFFLKNGFEEANPLLSYVWMQSPIAFVYVKVVLMACLVGGFYAVMRSEWHLKALKVLTVTYFALILYHISGMLYFFFF